MGLQYQNLDSKTRDFMLKEIELDYRNKNLYYSPRLSTFGQQKWEVLLKEAAKQYNDDWLANELKRSSCINIYEFRSMRSGATQCRVPFNAHETLAEGEFNRFYCRGLCARAIDEGIKAVEVYRGKSVENPRFESEAKIGKKFDASVLLNDLRTSQGVETALGIPKGPNSGITIKLP